MGSVSRIFGDNLRVLCARRPSIASVARDLDINKVQFNRYLTGQSYPKPEVLKQICRYFEVDARILLEPLNSANGVASCDLSGYIARGGDRFPEGPYRVTHISARFPGQIVRSLRMVRARRDSTCMSLCYPRAVRQALYGPRAARYAKSVADIQVAPQGFHAVIPEPYGLTVSFEYWGRAPNLPMAVWTGFSVYATQEAPEGQRAVRMVWEKIDNTAAAVLSAARTLGYADQDSLAPFEALLLKPGVPFQ